MKILHRTGSGDLATVFVASFRERDDMLAEFVDAKDPNLSLDEKWVVIVSTQFGCPVSCAMCDAGGDFKGDLTPSEIFSQIDHVVASHGCGKLVRAKKFKVQFARMGEPALNDAVLEVVRHLPERFDAPGLIPCIATIAPASKKRWFAELAEIRRTTYGGRPFQMQFSINSTDDATRDRLMPYPKLTFGEISTLAAEFSSGGPRKPALNFALAKGVPVDAEVIAHHFDPKHCCIKITPLNPTNTSAESGLSTALPPDAPHMSEDLCVKLQARGFDVILSIGDARENQIGSNCGMAIKAVLSRSSKDSTIISEGTHTDN